jgi:hypothetical protein
MFLDATSFVCLMSLGLLLLVSLNIDSGSLASWAESLISDTSRFHVLSKILLDPLEKKKTWSINSLLSVKSKTTRLDSSGIFYLRDILETTSL